MPATPPPAVTVGQPVFLDGPSTRQGLSNPILALNENNQAIIAYTVDSEVRAAYFDGAGWRSITTLFSSANGEGVLGSTAPTIQLAMNDHGQAAAVVDLSRNNLPQKPGRQVIDAIGIAYFDGADWVHKQIVPGDVHFKFNHEESSDAIAVTESGEAFLAYRRPVVSATDDRLVDDVFSILTFDDAGIRNSWDFGESAWFYRASFLSLNDQDQVAALFAGSYEVGGVQINHPFFLYDGAASWNRLPSPPSMIFTQTHLFLNNNGTAALFNDEGLFGFGFDGAKWTAFQPVPDFGKRRTNGDTVRTGETSYTFVDTFDDVTTSKRYFEVYEYDLLDLQSSRTISDDLAFEQPRARVFALDNGRLYATEHGIEVWVEDLRGDLSDPEALLLTDSAGDTDLKVNRSGFGIVADNSGFALQAWALRVR